jgi:hypothetical protein
MHAHLWIQDDHGTWTALHLEGSGWWIEADPATPGRPRPSRTPSSDRAPAAFVTESHGPDGNSVWVLMTRPAPAVRVNATPVPTGLRTLTDRDELRVAGMTPMYFSTERLPSVEILQGTADDPGICPRCRLPLIPNRPVVRCPGCDLTYHEEETAPNDEEERRNCWTYRPVCQSCDHPTNPQAGYRWTPADM